jgi:hypothetical protein
VVWFFVYGSERVVESMGLKDDEVAADAVDGVHPLLMLLLGVPESGSTL